MSASYNSHQELQDRVVNPRAGRPVLLKIRAVTVRTQVVKPEISNPATGAPKAAALTHFNISNYTLGDLSHF